MFRRLFWLIILAASSVAVSMNALAATPVIESAAVSEENSNTATHTVSFPTGIALNDLLIAIVSVDGTQDVTWPGNWNVIIQTTVGASTRTEVAWDEAAGTESGTFDVTTSGTEQSAHRVYRISGAEDPDTQPPEATVATGSSTTPDPPSITPTGGSETFLFIAYAGVNGSTNEATSFPTSYINTGTAATTGGGGISINWATRALTAASEDPSTFNNGGGDGWVTVTIAIHPSGVSAPSFSVSPTVTATTATTYTIGYTASQATTFYTVACNPGESAPTVAQIKTADCGSGANAESSANEAVTGADTTQMTSISFPRHDIYSALSDAGGDSAVVTLADEDRAVDTNQTIVALTSVSATSVFSLATDVTCDTDGSTSVMTGCTDTSDFQVGMAIDVSIGFSGTGPFLIDALTATTITVDENSTSSQTNPTVTSDVYYNPATATGDVIEHDDTVACSAGTDTVTWAVDGNFSYTATTCGSTLTTLDYCVQDVSDVTGQYTTPACWSTDDKIYLFNTAPVCDSEPTGVLVMAFNTAMPSEDFAPLCNDVDLHTITHTVFSGTLPTGTSLSTAGVLTGTPTVEDEVGVTIRIKGTDVGGLADTIDNRQIWVVDTVTMPAIDDSDLTNALSDYDSSFPWNAGDRNFTATFECGVEAINQILSQGPAASTEVAAEVAVSVVVASGVCGSQRTQGLGIRGVRAGM